MQKGLVSVFRLALVCLVVFASFGGIAARLVHLQVFERDELVSEVERARKRVRILHARRGEIRDSNGNLLAVSRPVVQVGVDPHSVRVEDEPMLPHLAELLGLPVEKVVEAFNRKTVTSSDGRRVRQVRWVKLADGVSEETYEDIMLLGIKGVYGNRQYRRTYPGGSLAAHIIGYINRENTAVMGVERYMDFYLRGQDGWREQERDGRGGELAQFRGREILPRDGYHVVLSIDSVVQHYVEAELRRIVDKFDPVGATIIVSDPKTGYILALANHPTFDLNSYNTADIASQRNRAITDIYEPGSTFKIVAASAALDLGLVNPQTTFDCSLEAVSRRGRLQRLPGDTHHYESLTVAEIVAKSSNRGAAHLGILLGENRLYQYARAFGFGQETGFAFGGEVAGILHPVDKWDGLTITRLPMGHAVGVTPMQIHSAMAAIANDGVLMRPQVSRRIIDRDGNIVAEFQPIERRRVVSRETAREMAHLLMGVCAPGGTAPKAAIPGFEVAGKTGTTQKIIDGRYSRSHHVGSFIGFFPASDPRLVISVIIDDARLSGTAYGSTVAAPSFKAIGEKLIQYLGISPVAAPPVGSLAGGPDNFSLNRDRIR
ncbi:MAG: penicillin-binding protein 2 [Verrucomicrobia bacterium]|nr:MAG: penicillin-binding protein 2 [Verrucomicrobiota bacterium]